MKEPFKFGDISANVYFLGITSILGIIFALISANETNTNPLWVTLIQWQAQTVLPIFFLLGSHLILQRMHVFNGLNPWVKLFISGLMGALAFTPIALVLDFWLLEHSWPVSANQLITELLEEAGGVTPPIVIVWMLINAPWVLNFEIKKVDGSIKSTETGDFPSSRNPAPASKKELNIPFLSLARHKINPHEILAIKAALHYLEVITSDGNELILYNLKDAIAELPTELGTQTHRSYWVAFNAIDNFYKKGREAELELINKEKIPISRGRVKDIARKIAENNDEIAV